MVTQINNDGRYIEYPTFSLPPYSSILSETPRLVILLFSFSRHSKITHTHTLSSTPLTNTTVISPTYFPSPPSLPPTIHKKTPSTYLPTLPLAHQTSILQQKFTADKV